MRILQVVHGFPPREHAGTELVTYHLSQALQARGHDVTVFARTEAPEAREFSVQEEVVNGLRVVRVVNNYTHTTTFPLFYENPFFDEQFAELLEHSHPDVVHFQHLAHLSVTLMALAASLGYPSVLSLHDFFFPCHLLHLVDTAGRLCPGPDRGERCVSCLQGVATPAQARRRFLEMERALRVSDRILVPSTFLKQRVQEYFPVVERQLRVVPPGIGPIARRPRARRPRPPLRALYVGALLRHKGAHVLIEALRGLPDKSVEVSLYGTIVPFWRDYVDRLRQDAEGLPVRFCGTYAHDQVESILCDHDVLVIPAVGEETFSLVAREALQAGLPVIAARRGALPEIVSDGENGLLFEAEDAADLRRCLQRVAAENDLLERLSAEPGPLRGGQEYAGEVEALYDEVRPRPVTQRPHAESIVAKAVREGTGGPLSSGPSRVRLSVCIPVYNGKAFLAEAVESVLGQSFGDFELLLVDDASTDGSLDLLRSLADPRIRIYQNAQRLGLPGNWNRCIALARGEYVCLFHQDDAMRPENLDKKMRVLTADPTVGLVHSAAEVFVDGPPPSLPTAWMEDAAEDFVVEGSVYFRRLIFKGNLICAPTVVAPRQRLLDLGGFDEELGFTADYEMWLKACVDGRVAFLSEPLVRYRWHAENATHPYRFERGVEERFLAAQRAVAYFVERSGRRDEGLCLSEAVAALTRIGRWVAELERAKAWLTQERASWRNVAEDRDHIIQEQKGWIRELEKGKAWLEEQWQLWIRVSREHERQKAWLEQKLARWEASRLVRAGVRLGILEPLRPPPPPDGEEDSSG